MKTPILKLTVLLCLVATVTDAQITRLDNQATANTEYVGWNGSGSFSKDLDINNKFNEHINLFTNDIHRIKLNPDVNYTINGYAGDRDGYMLLGHSAGGSASLFNSDTLGAFSLLHLNGPLGGLAQQAGHRPWMNTGITFTDNGDLSYMGLLTVVNSVAKALFTSFINLREAAIFQV